MMIFTGTDMYCVTCFRDQSAKLSPNIDRPLFDSERAASSWRTSQCSANTPSAMRTTSAAIQFLGRPVPENRPWTMTKSPSATITPGSYLRRGSTPDKEETFAARLDVGAVLNVVGRPEAFSGRVISPVEQGVERFKDERLVL